MEQKKAKKEYSIVKYILYRIKKNKNFLVTLTGPTGSGKSWSALSMGELLDEEFNVDRVVFSGTELMKLINGGTLKSGSVIIWDEAGVNLSNRNWQSAINKMMNFLLQTFRHKNFILIFTVPYHDFVDASTRKLFHADFQTVSISRAKNTCRIKPKLMQYNANMKKWYYHYLKVVKPNDGMIKINRWDVPKPSKELVEQYEMKKNRFTKTLNFDIQKTMENIEKTDNRPELTPLQKKIVECWKAGLFVQKEIAKELKKVPPHICDNVKWMKKKGYIKEDYMKESN